MFTKTFASITMYLFLVLTAISEATGSLWPGTTLFSNSEKPGHDPEEKKCKSQEHLSMV